MNIQMKQLSVLLTLLTTLSFSTLAKDHKQGARGDEMQRHMRQVMSKLDLSNEQQEQIKAIQVSRKEQMKSLKVDFSEHRQRIAELIKAPEFDEVAFTNIQAKMADNKMQLSLITAKSMHQMYQVLTPEQRQEFEQYRQKRQSKKQSK